MHPVTPPSFTALPSADLVITLTHLGVTSMPVSRDLPRRLLGVWAHPDDEAYLSAGLMARTVDHGGQVTVISATHGEQGTGDPELAGSPAFAAHREAELRASLAELGVHDLRMLDIGDGQCADIDPDGPTSAIAAVIDEVQPDVIVTFGPDGITWHPDHQAVSAWTTAAWQRADRTGELLYAAMTGDFTRTHSDLHARLGLFDEFGPGRPVVTAVSDIAIECSLDAGELARKRRALARHASQTDGLAAVMGEEVFTHWWRDEVFRCPTTAELLAATAMTTQLTTA